MWFMLGFLFGILFTIAAIVALAWWAEHFDRKEQVTRWINRFENKAEASFDRKVKPVQGSIGRFVLKNGEIVRANDD